ncbi:MAG: aldehyde dehydrogenase family protein, partial [Planctomycetota bacterium]
MPALQLDNQASDFLGQDVLNHFVDGDYAPGSEAAFDVLDPATAQPVARVAMASDGDVDQAVQAAHAAFGTWSAMTPNERSVLLHRLAERVDSELETIAQLESLDVGKAIGAARFDVPFGGECLRYFADLATR